MTEKDVVVRELLKSVQRMGAMKPDAEHSDGIAGSDGINGNYEYHVEKLDAEDGITGYYGYHRWAYIPDDTFQTAILTELRQGNLIAAIRLCRKHYPCPLKYAKQSVLAWRRTLGLEAPLTEGRIEEPSETFDVRWHTTIHPEKHFIDFRFELQVADRSIPDLGTRCNAVSWPELVASKESDGDYGIFTCNCGDMGCGGFSEVEVIHVDGRTLWYNQGYSNIFDEVTYKTAIGRVEAALIELTQNYPNLPVKSWLDWA